MSSKGKKTTQTICGSSTMHRSRHFTVASLLATHVVFVPTGTHLYCRRDVSIFRPPDALFEERERYALVNTRRACPSRRPRTHSDGQLHRLQEEAERISEIYTGLGIQPFNIQIVIYRYSLHADLSCIVRAVSVTEPQLPISALISLDKTHLIEISLLLVLCDLRVTFLS